MATTLYGQKKITFKMPELNPHVFEQIKRHHPYSDFPMEKDSLIYSFFNISVKDDRYTISVNEKGTNKRTNYYYSRNWHLREISYFLGGEEFGGKKYSPGGELISEMPIDADPHYPFTLKDVRQLIYSLLKRDILSVQYDLNQGNAVWAIMKSNLGEVEELYDRAKQHPDQYIWCLPSFEFKHKTDTPYIYMLTLETDFYYPGAKLNYGYYFMIDGKTGEVLYSFGPDMTPKFNYFVPQSTDTLDNSEDGEGNDPKLSTH